MTMKLKCSSHTRTLALLFGVVSFCLITVQSQANSERPIFEVVYRGLRCQNKLAEPQSSIIDLDRLKMVEVFLKRQSGTFSYPNQFGSSGFRDQVYVLRLGAEEDTSQSRLFSRDLHSNTDFRNIFRVVSLEEMRKLTVLDFPCGKGDFVNETRREGVDIYGADIYLTSTLLKTLQFLPANMSWSPFKDQTFDLILSIDGPLSGLSQGFIGSSDYEEIKRLLKPGGRLLVGFVTQNQALAVRHHIKKWPGLQYMDFHPNPHDDLGLVEIRRQ